MFQPTKEWVNKVHLSSFKLENFFKFVLALLAREKPNNLTPLGQSERVYYLSYFIKGGSSIHFTITGVRYIVRYIKDVVI